MVLAEKEFAWTTAEMIKASRQMGYGDNWKAAVEKTKTEHAPPGGQPAMIRDLIYQAVDYLRANDLVTIPGIDAESQRMSMMTAAAQTSNPFFPRRIGDSGVVPHRWHGVRCARAGDAGEQLRLRPCHGIP